jgi:hypothetical protein
MKSSNPLPRRLMGTPAVWNSSVDQPCPRPTRSRPLLSRSTVASWRPSAAGTWNKASSTLVPSRITSVFPAINASVSSGEYTDAECAGSNGSRAGATGRRIRSSTHSESRPSSSARCANATMPSGLASAPEWGSAAPSFMLAAPGNRSVGQQAALSSAACGFNCKRTLPRLANGRMTSCGCGRGGAAARRSWRNAGARAEVVGQQVSGRSSRFDLRARPCSGRTRGP